MRVQARASRDFLQAWSRNERRYRAAVFDAAERHRRSEREFLRREAKGRQGLARTFERHRDLIAAGRHLWWLNEFAVRYLLDPDAMHEVTDDAEIVETALTNCFEFVARRVPTLEEVGRRTEMGMVTILKAACLATFRRKGSLEGIDVRVLQAARADGPGGNGYREGEAQRIRDELDGRLFRTGRDAVDFLRRYVEPQLALDDGFATQTHPLETLPMDDAARGALAIEWLDRFPAMPWTAMEALFRIAAAFGEPALVRRLIDDRCRLEIGPFDPAHRRRRFWLLRHVFFATPVEDDLWAEFARDRDAVLAIERHAGSLRFDLAAGWPELRADKLVRILEAFVDRWPPVFLPSSFGSSSSDGETAAIDRLLSDPRFEGFANDLKSLGTRASRRIALEGFEPPERFRDEVAAGKA